MRSGRIVAVIIGLSTNIELVDVLGWGQNIGVAQISARRDIKIARFPTKGTMVGVNAVSTRYSYGLSSVETSGRYS
jgi:hypothetical protein